MEKDFDRWNEVKKAVDRDNDGKLYHAREAWWCAVGINVGFEQDGGGSGSQRPILVLKGLSRNTCLVVPLTRSSRAHRYRIPIGIVDGENASAILSQMRVVDTKRFVEKIGFIDKQSFEIIRKAVKNTF